MLLCLVGCEDDAGDLLVDKICLVDDDGESSSEDANDHVVVRLWMSNCFVVERAKTGWTDHELVIASGASAYTNRYEFYANLRLFDNQRILLRVIIIIY